MQESTTRTNELVQSITARTGPGAVRGLCVRLDDRHITIAGQAASYYIKQLVTQTAMSAAGRRRVRNQISVSQMAGRPQHKSNEDAAGAW